MLRLRNASLDACEDAEGARAITEDGQPLIGCWFAEMERLEMLDLGVRAAPKLSFLVGC